MFALPRSRSPLTSQRFPAVCPPRPVRFDEGIRALLIDKDKAPKWSPTEIEHVPPSLVQSHFAPLADPALELDV